MYIVNKFLANWIKSSWYIVHYFLTSLHVIVCLSVTILPESFHLISLIPKLLIFILDISSSTFGIPKNLRNETLNRNKDSLPLLPKKLSGPQSLHTHRLTWLVSNKCMHRVVFIIRDGQITVLFVSLAMSPNVWIQLCPHRHSRLNNLYICILIHLFILSLFAYA